ncbi:MAG: NifU family protein [Bacteroidales bacterium]|nr:NifU family protein [Bacteroidales bacterium]
MKKPDKINIVKQALANLRPYLQQDGGDIIFVDLSDDDILKIKFADCCKDCKFKEKTKIIVEKQIRKFFPDLKSMIEVED